MKYIRTKDGIHWNIFDGALSPQTWVGEPIVEADTIEELCDEIVITRNEKPYYSNSPIGKSKSWKAYQPLVKETKGVYGAIWTDKGLIYAAKMNDKGELELL